MLQINDISFSYKENLVLHDLSFSVKKGEHFAIMGESGCGKSTLLQLIYGILQPNTGSIRWGEQFIEGPLFSLVPGKPFMKYMSQSFDLMGVTTVAENISEYLTVTNPVELKTRTKELLEMIEMSSYENKKVKELSIGQQQRVALARALAQEPELLLLDEPFSHIDNFKKNSLRRSLFAYLKEKKITCLTATHDHQDILPFADRVMVLKDKGIIANKPIMELYKNPKELYVASLFGEANSIPIEVLKSYANTKRRIIVYAHEFRISYSSGLPAKVIQSYTMGSYYLIKALSSDIDVYFHSDKDISPETELFLNIPLEVINLRLRE
ncbi:ABC transporter ATP-binding protein [Eudoraea chungangensis]|uniref:ABC transporter ATP-binding protein n=1 Tax=Eudoraea chungangensis TaxID=1481905 RepID=UPI0023EAE86A|nr:ABC transporter ATP-binding protein [Eudoraea chungangensis]